MPAFVKTPEDERLWNKAKGLAEEAGQKENWAYVTGIYKQMKGGKVAHRIAAAWIAKQGAAPEALTLLRGLLADLRALFFIHWTGHWQAEGPTSYGGHLLLERLYDGDDEDDDIDDEIDELAEKMVAQFGTDAVDLDTTMPGMLRAIQQVPGTGMARSLRAEQMFLSHLDDTYERLESLGELTMGLDDLLQGIANKHETHVYLLQQRLRG